MSSPYPPADRGRSWFKYFQYDEGRDSPSEARNVLLVIATLIAAVTFQAGVNPPGGVWQDNDKGHKAGQAIYASQEIAFYVFLVSNTLALSTSILVIVSLTYRFPFHFEVWVATASMIVTYASAIFAVTPNESVRFRYILVAAGVPFAVRTLIQICKKLRNR
ncbi:uncharacterized protein LOC116209059 [Punica granatum]|uniref:Uncharacterized protein LOC116209059 n=2 Tax=Punica granatum TaxID=22663 RepID=A0A218WRJ0_PUNGR|nr:uncharacterized protein LOC116209059 [Punica granatum]OWM75129.1 hypothetical protein CDL15_Pgr017255 [Punica granatum]